MALPRTPPTADPRGFVLPVVLLLGLIVGALALGFHSRTRHRNSQVRRGRDRAITKYLARAGIDLVQNALREARHLDVGQVQPNTSSGRLTAYLLDPAPILEEKFARDVAGLDDHRPFLEKLMGPEVFAPLDRLESRYPGARIRLEVNLRTEPAAEGSVVVDPVVKTVIMTVRSEASQGVVTWAYQSEEPIWVHSRLPSGASRFTLALTSAGPDTHLLDRDGNHRGGPPPVVLLHRPEDGDPFGSSLLEPGGILGPGLGPGVPEPDRIGELSAGRGLVFIGGRGSPILPLADGGQPYGEAHLLGRTADGLPARPRLVVPGSAPEAFAGFSAPAPYDPDIDHIPYLRATVAPMGERTAALLHPSPPRMPLVEVSRLKLYGTPTHPSPTVVVGRARRSLARLARIDIDRDRREDDERAQRLAVGQDLPVPDGRGPTLHPVAAPAWESALAAERTGSSAPGSLAPFGTRVENLNRHADLDDDGIPETAVGSEVPFHPLPLDANAWTYGALFGGYEEYRRFMSAWVSFPANMVLDLAGRSRTEVQERLTSVLVGADPEAENFPEWAGAGNVIEHRDALHETFGPGRRTYLDATDRDPGTIASALGGGLIRRHPGDEPIQIQGQEEFETRFMTGGTIDLGGLRVQVLPEEREDPPPLLVFEQPIRVRPGSGGILETPIFKAPSLENPGEDSSFAPFVLRTGSLILTSPGPIEAAMTFTHLAVEGDADRVVLRGPVVIPSLPGDLGVPLIVQYDPRYDPTGVEATREYRIDMPHRSARIYTPEDESR